jgi:hypothetical protein
MVPTISIRSLHLEYQLWLRELIFYKEEIKIYEDHLQVYASKLQNYETAVSIEQFQNQFLLQKDVIDFLKHDLNISEKQLARFAMDLSEDGIEGIKMDNHVQLRDRMFTFRKIYKELKHGFRQFESAQP